MADMTTIKGRIRETIYPNGTGAIKAAEHQALLLEMVDDINTKKQDNIEDIDAIRAGAKLGETALQELPDLSHLATKDEVKTGLATKANTTGRYPDLSVGFADDLAGRGESVPASFGFRASGGKSIKDGAARIKRLKGNSVVWNQQVNILSTVANDTSSAQYMGLTYTYDEYSNILTINGTSTKTWQNSVLVANSVAGHTYYISARKVGGTYTSVGGKELQIQEGYGGVVAKPESSSESVGTLTGFTGVRANLGVSCGVGDVFDNYQVRVQYIDLTQMFQAGNEPTTIEEFNARVATLGVDMNAYNEGEVIHCNTESIKSVGENAWDEEWITGRLNTNTGQPNPGNNGITSKNYIRVLPNETYYCGYNAAPIFAMFYDAEYALITGVNGSNNFVSIRNTQFTTPENAAYMRFYIVDITTYNNDIMISLVHSGWKQDTDAGYQPYWQDTLPLPIIRKYFPQGMKKAGTAHDEIRYNKASGKWEYSKGKIKSVDLGTMNWSLFSSYGFYAPVPSDMVVGNLNYLTEMSYTKYANPDRVTWEGLDKAITNGLATIGTSWVKYLVIKDSAYTDAATFKAAMAGVILYYESNDWEWVELDAEDQNFRDYYNVADFGTEEAIPATDAEGNIIPSANFSADIIYQFNAVDMIREHELEITELQSIIATMQAQLASLINKE